MSAYEELRTGAAWLDLTGRGMLGASGEDRARLLHAMSTNDVQGLAPGKGLYAFFLSAQGRILADAHLFNLGDTLLLDTEPEIGRKLFEHLDKYIIADDVTLEDLSANRSVVSLEGPRSVEVAQQMGLPVPDEALGMRISADSEIWVARVASSASEGLRFWLPLHRKTEFVNRLVEVLQATPEDARIVRLENAHPRYGEEITERYLVQETGLLHGVHFNKGCYLGQEIVERVRSRAQVHRHLRPIEIEAQQAPASGTKLSIDGKDVAEIVSAAFSPALRLVVGFAYVRTEALDANGPMHVNGSEPPITAEVRSSR